MVDISIIILNYNKNELSINLLNQLLDHFYLPKIEIIFVDNASKEQDHLQSEVERIFFDRANCKSLWLKENFGPSGGRNRGAAKAKGKYLQFIDSDDWIHPEKLNIQLQYAAEHKFPALIASRWARVPFDSAPNNVRFNSLHDPDFSQPLILSLISSTGFVHISSMIIDRETFEEVGGFREDTWLIEDVQFTIELAYKHGNFHICPSQKPLSFYRVNSPESLSKSDPLSFHQQVLSNARIAYRYLRDSKTAFSEKEIGIFSDIFHYVLVASYKERLPQLAEDAFRLRDELDYGLQPTLIGWRKFIFNKVGPATEAWIEAFLYHTKKIMKTIIGRQK